MIHLQQQSDALTEAVPKQKINKPKIKLTQKQKQLESNFSLLLHYVESTFHKVKILNYRAFYQLISFYKVKDRNHTYTTKIWHTILYETILVKLELNKTQIITYKWNILETLNVANGLRRAFWLDAKRQYEQHRSSTQTWRPQNMTQTAEGFKQHLLNINKDNNRSYCSKL